MSFCLAAVTVKEGEMDGNDTDHALRKRERRRMLTKIRQPSAHHKNITFTRENSLGGRGRAESFGRQDERVVYARLYKTCSTTKEWVVGSDARGINGPGEQRCE